MTEDHRDSEGLVFAGQTLAETIGLLRRRSQLTADQVAREAGLSPSSVRAYETGRTIPDLFVSRRIVRVLAEHLRHDVDKLWRDIGVIAERFSEGSSDLLPTMTVPVPLPIGRLLITNMAYRLNVEPDEAWRVVGQTLDSLGIRVDPPVTEVLGDLPEQG